MSPVQRSRSRIAVTVDGETATQAPPVGQPRRRGLPAPGRPRPARAGNARRTGRCARGARRTAPAPARGRTHGVKNGIPFWQSRTASKDRRCASSQPRTRGYTVNRPPILVTAIPSRRSARSARERARSGTGPRAPRPARPRAISQAYRSAPPAADARGHASWRWRPGGRSRPQQGRRSRRRSRGRERSGAGQQGWRGERGAR